MPIQLGAFVLSNSKRNMKKFVHAIDRYYTNDLKYQDIDGMCFEIKHWDKLDEVGLVGKKRIQGKNDYKGGRFGTVHF